MSPAQPPPREAGPCSALGSEAWAPTLWRETATLQTPWFAQAAPWALPPLGPVRWPCSRAALRGRLAGPRPAAHAFGRFVCHSSRGGFSPAPAAGFPSESGRLVVCAHLPVSSPVTPVGPAGTPRLSGVSLEELCIYSGFCTFCLSRVVCELRTPPPSRAGAMVYWDVRPHVGMTRTQDGQGGGWEAGRRPWKHGGAGSSGRKEIWGENGKEKVCESRWGRGSCRRGGTPWVLRGGSFALRGHSLCLETSSVAPL